MIRQRRLPLRQHDDLSYWRGAYSHPSLSQRRQRRCIPAVSPVTGSQTQTERHLSVCRCEAPSPAPRLALPLPAIPRSRPAWSFAAPPISPTSTPPPGAAVRRPFPRPLTRRILPQSLRFRLSSPARDMFVEKRSALCRGLRVASRRLDPLPLRDRALTSSWRPLAADPRRCHPQSRRGPRLSIGSRRAQPADDA